MLPYIGIHSIHAKEYLLPQELTALRQQRAVKGELAVQMSQPLPHHVYHTEVITVKLVIIPAGINQNSPVCPDFSVRIKSERPRLAVCHAQVIPVVKLFTVPSGSAPEDGQIRQIVFKMDLVLCKHIVNRQVSFVYMDIPAVGPK